MSLEFGGFDIPLSGLDLNNHESAISELKRVNAAFIGITATVIGMRLFVRARFVKHLGIDDILMVLAGFFAIAYSTMCLVGTRYGLGRHEWDLDLSTVIELNKKVIMILWSCQILYATALSLVKLSIIASYLRVFPIPIFRRIMFVIAITITLVWICSILVTVFECKPVQATWDFTLPGRQCFQVVNYYYFSNAYNILTDLLLCTLPVPLFWKLNLPKKERVILCMLFMLGLFATIASVLRITQLHDAASFDVTFETVPSLYWSAVEVGTGIVCACIPTLKPLLKSILTGNAFSMKSKSSVASGSQVKTRADGSEFEMIKSSAGDIVVTTRPYSASGPSEGDGEGDEDGIMETYRYQQTMAEYGIHSQTRPGTGRPSTNFSRPVTGMGIPPLASRREEV